MFGMPTISGRLGTKSKRLQKRRNMAERSTACEKFPLHRAIFEGNLRKVSCYLRVCDVSEKDLHGKMYLKSVKLIRTFFQLVLHDFLSSFLLIPV